MSLRSKLLALFITLGVLPLAAAGVLGSLQSMRALEALLARQTGEVAEEVARVLAERLARQESDALLFGENADTQRLYSARDPAARAAAAAQADTFLRAAWTQVRADYRAFELRDAAGATLYRLGDDAPRRMGARTVSLERPVRDVERGTPYGTLVLHASLDALLPDAVVGRRVGEAGYSVVVDRGAGRTLYHSDAAWVGQPLARLAGREPWAGDSAALDAPRGVLRFGRGDSARVASFVSLRSPAWTVLVVAGVSEFAPPFERARSAQLLLVLAITGAVTLASVLLLRRATHSLEALTLAADAVGRGNLDPRLPRSGADEVGRLTRAFDVMVGRVRDMIAQVETSRQMAVLGEFASQVAHEIRNPLTSVKLNLQGLTRDARAGVLPPASADSVAICLTEIDRLDAVVRGVLSLAQQGPTHREPCALHAVAARALALVASQAEAQGVAVTAALRAADDVVLGDAARLQGAVLNVLLNALAAMPGGGALHVASEGAADGRAVRLRIADGGPGVPADARERIFRPFHTTRPDGTGLGLPIARRTAEAHGGRLWCGERPAGEQGAEFVLELPLAAAGHAP